MKGKFLPVRQNAQPVRQETDWKDDLEFLEWNRDFWSHPGQDSAFFSFRDSGMFYAPKVHQRVHKEEHEFWHRVVRKSGFKNLTEADRRGRWLMFLDDLLIDALHAYVKDHPSAGIMFALWEECAKAPLQADEPLGRLVNALYKN